MEKIMTLENALKLMDKANKKGYEIHFEGLGDGKIKIVVNSNIFDIINNGKEKE